MTRHVFDVYCRRCGAYIAGLPCECELRRDAWQARALLTLGLVLLAASLLVW